MKTVALLVYAESTEELLAECRRQIDLIPKDEYTFELFVNPDLDEPGTGISISGFTAW